MKELIVFLCLLFVSLAVLAQSEKRSHISISGGPSFPTGAFKLKDFSNEQAGFAKTGGFLDIAYGYRFSKYIGGMALLKGKMYGVDFSDYRLPIGTGIGMKMETTTWRSIVLHAGVFSSLPLDRLGQFHLEIKGLAGIQENYSPEMKVQFTGTGAGTIATTGNQESAKATSFSYMVGTGLKYYFSPAFGVLLSADFNRSKPRFENVKGSAGGTRFDVSSDQVISSVDVGLGVVVAF